MRLLVLILGGALGWIGGSLYPAPSAWLAWSSSNAIEQPLDAAQSADPSLATPAQALGTTAAPSGQPSRRGAVDAQTLAQYRAWIREARLAHPYADSEERMYAVMMCESRGHADALNPAGPYTGLFQYSSVTWNGAWNTYRDQGMLDPRAQIFATALAWQRNMQRHWGCY